MVSKSRKFNSTYVTVAVWLLTVGSGVAALWGYSFRSCNADSAVGVWPSDSEVVRDRSCSTLIVFVHPQCSCTRATVSQLATVRRNCSVPYKLVVVMLQPEKGLPWRDTPMQSDIARLKPVQLVDDPGGREAIRFGVGCSGTCLLFSLNGQLLFRGGITESRGHEGTCVGSRQLLACLSHSSDGSPTASVSQNPIYGCSLVSTDR